MPVIICHVSAETGSGHYLEDLSTNWWRLQQEDVDTDLILVSGDNRVRVHQAVLLPLSALLRDLVPVCCPCTIPAITLPLILGDTLTAFVEIIYTGRSKVVSKTAKEEFVELIRILQIGIEVHYEKFEYSVDLVNVINPLQEHLEEASDLTIEQVGKIEPTVQQEERVSPIVQELEGRMITVQKVGGSSSIVNSTKQMAVTNICERPNSAMKNNQSEGAKSPDILAKTTRYQKRKIQSMLNESKENDELPECKKKRLDSIMQQPGEAYKFINVRDILDVDMTGYVSAKESSNNQKGVLVPDPIMMPNVQENSPVSIMELNVQDEVDDVNGKMEQSTSVDAKKIEEEIDFFKYIGKKAFQEGKLCLPSWLGSQNH